MIRAWQRWLILVTACTAAALNMGAADRPKTPPKELVQYVNDAGRLGLKEAAIRQNAIEAGWSAAAVDEAIAFTHGGGTAEAAPGRLIPRPGAAGETGEPAKNHGVPEDYRIGAGDVLQVLVWKEPDASVPNVVVRPDGKITMPLLKEIEVVGMTPREVEAVVTEGLSKMINAADVTVVVTEINSKKIYTVGAVKREGPIAYTYRMSVMQALSEAGGLTEYARRRKIYVLRSENGKEYRLLFNYDAVIRGEGMEQNIPLLPGDTIVVPH